MDNNQYNSFIKSAEKFIEVFEEYKNKNIVLYGLGQYTATLINLAKEYHFIGLLDGDEKNISKRVYGLKVLSLDHPDLRRDPAGHAESDPDHLHLCTAGIYRAGDR